MNESDLEFDADLRARMARLPAFGLLVAIFIGQIVLAPWLQVRHLLAGLFWCQLFLFAVPPLLACWRDGLSTRAVLRLRWPRWPIVVLAFGIGAANAYLAGGLQALARELLPESVGAVPDPGRFFEGGPIGEGLMVFAVVLFVPCCEELLFRGYLQRILWARHSRLAAIVASALLFTLMHLEPAGAPARLEMGLLFGAIAALTGSLWPAVAAHAGNNTLVAFATMLRPDEVAEASLGEALAAGGVAAVVVAALLWALARVVRSAGPIPEERAYEARFSDWRRPLAVAFLAAAGTLALFLTACSRAQTVP